MRPRIDGSVVRPRIDGSVVRPRVDGVVLWSSVHGACCRTGLRGIAVAPGLGHHCRAGLGDGAGAGIGRGGRVPLPLVFDAPVIHVDERFHHGVGDLLEIGEAEPAIVELSLAQLGEDDSLHQVFELFLRGLFDGARRGFDSVDDHHDPRFSRPRFHAGVTE